MTKRIDKLIKKLRFTDYTISGEQFHLKCLKDQYNDSILPAAVKAVDPS